jgi:hypothetical protein
MMRGTRGIVAGAVFLVVWAGAAVEGTRGDEPPTKLEPGVRGLVTRSPGPVTLDGSLREWSEAFCTPVHYNHARFTERAAQFFYMWDEEAFYVGLRCLDTRQANPAALPATYDGDAVEFYLDTRAGDALKGKDWSDGAIHFYFSPFQGSELAPRWVMRQGIATSKTVLNGVAIAARRTSESYDVEFKLPWSNFPGFRPRLGAVLALDAELCSGDGARRTDRTFAYGSPLSVQQPASLGKVELVKSFDPEFLPAAGAAAFPLWVDTPWVQPNRAEVQAVVAIPPAFASVVGEVEVRIHDTEGKVVRTLPARVEPFGPERLGFVRAIARWSVDDHAPGTYLATARVSSRTGKTLVTVAPRLVAEAIISGR